MIWPWARITTFEYYCNDGMWREGEPPYETFYGCVRNFTRNLPNHVKPVENIVSIRMRRIRVGYAYREWLGGLNPIVKYELEIHYSKMTGVVNEATGVYELTRDRAMKISAEQAASVEELGYLPFHKTTGMLAW